MVINWMAVVKIAGFAVVFGFFVFTVDRSGYNRHKVICEQQKTEVVADIAKGNQQVADATEERREQGNQQVVVRDSELQVAQAQNETTQRRINQAQSSACMTSDDLMAAYGYERE